jgi:hypothetical protein
MNVTILRNLIDTKGCNLKPYQEILEKYHFLTQFNLQPLDTNYMAGACFPLPTPLGCLRQLNAVNEVKLLKDCPQCLQVYLLFSLPSYNLCFPFPAGCLEQLNAVKLETDENICPQYSQ